MMSTSSGRSKTRSGKRRFIKMRMPPKKIPKMREISRTIPVSANTARIRLPMLSRLLIEVASDRKKTLHQDANASKKNPKDERDQQNDPGQRKHCEDQITDVVALAHRGGFVPRDLGFVVYGVKKRMCLAAPDGAGDDIDQGAAAPYQQRVRRRLFSALQSSQAFAGDLRRRILNQRQRERPARGRIVLHQNFGIMAEVNLLGREWPLLCRQRLRAEDIFGRVFHSMALRQVPGKTRQVFG